MMKIDFFDFSIIDLIKFFLLILTNFGTEFTKITIKIHLDANPEADI